MASVAEVPGSFSFFFLFFSFLAHVLNASLCPVGNDEGLID